MDTRKLMKRLGTVALFGALALGVVSTARSASKTGPNDKDVTKAARNATAPGAVDDREPMPLVGHLGAPGTIEPADEAMNLITQSAGVVKEILVKEGDQVVAGQVLVRLHDEVEAAIVAGARADVEAARAQLAKVLRGARIEDVRDGEALAEAARLSAEQSRREATRVAALQARDAASQDEADAAEAKAQVDARTAAAAEARFRALANGSRREDVALARAQLEQAEARLAQAQAQLDRLVLRAPIAGEILDVLVRPGELVNPLQPQAGAALIMGDTTRVRARLQIDERDVARVKVGQRGWVTAAAYGAQRFPGHVVEVNRRMGQKTLVTSDPGEKLDVQVLDVILELDGTPPVIQGLRVTGTLEDAS